MRFDLCRNEPEGEVKLWGQFRLFRSACQLPVRAGACVYEITVLSGKLRVNHYRQINLPEMWMRVPPASGQPDRYLLKAGERRVLTLTVSEQRGGLEQIEVLNRGLWRSAIFRYVAKLPDDGRDGMVDPLT